MSAKFLTIFTLLTLAVSSPAPANVNQPISSAEWEAIAELGLKVRNVNAPITDAEYQALQDIGAITSSNSLKARDSILKCGKTITGHRAGGNGVWVPINQFLQAADEFCQAYVGTDVALNHETSDEYSITLTNQKYHSEAGPAGNLVFAIYNTARDPAYVVDHDTCYNAMIAPLKGHLTKRENSDELVKLRARNDGCWGSKNDDYQGGYYSVNGIGAFGSEVYKV
ncbi:hypothetical protein F4678DRAFT_481785 [Xylaria arbuscula]|nr:hypothetical protein F4678DRAFT_481785 [Xylaria arbuscula]